MKIAHLSKPWIPVPPVGYGGVERHIYSLILEQQKKYSVYLFAPGDSIVPDTIKLHALFNESLGDKGLDRNTEVAQALDFALTVQKENIDLLHIHSVDSFLAIAPFLGKRSVFTFYTHPTETTKILTKYAEPFTTFTFVSQQHRRQYPWLRHAEIVYQGVELDMFPFAATKKDYLAFVGSIADKKGIIEAIEISKLCNMRLLVGAKVKSQDNDFYLKEVKPLLDKSKHVTFLGEVNDAERNKLLMDAKAMLFPIKWEEPFGGVMAESMAVGTPVIGFNRGAAPELIEDGKTGYIVENIEQAVAAVGKLDRLNPYDCRKRIAEHFSIQRTVEAFGRIYASLDKKSRA